jgi:septal ring-binding cell division protein DamX
VAAISDATGGNAEQLWIFEQAAELFTLQVGSYKSLESAQTAASRLKLNSDPLLKHQQSSDGKWYYLLYGAYKTTELADAASETLNLTEPWIRSFENLQKNRCKTVEANSVEASYCKPE